MIVTNCEECCFLKQDDKGGKGCALNQMCILKDQEVFAPGYCRLCRSTKWCEKQSATNLPQLYSKIVEEQILKFDMLIFFDEAVNQIEDLERTLNSDWYAEYAQKIIIADTTGFGNRQNLALQYLNSKEHKIPTTVDSSVVHESVEQSEETIRRLSKQVTAPLFMTIPAGNIVSNIGVLARIVQHLPSRVVQWSFPFSLGGTVIVSNKLYYGLFITKPYKTLTKSSTEETKSFTQQLRKEEIETEMGLSWLCTRCELI